jgi:hypothetical protein
MPWQSGFQLTTVMYLPEGDFFATIFELLLHGPIV